MVHSREIWGIARLWITEELLKFWKVEIRIRWLQLGLGLGLVQCGGGVYSADCRQLRICRSH